MNEIAQQVAKMHTKTPDSMERFDEKMILQKLVEQLFDTGVSNNAFVVANVWDDLVMVEIPYEWFEQRKL